MLLHNLEYAATLASLMPQENSKDPYAYPKEAVDSLWEDGDSPQRSMTFSLRLIIWYSAVVPIP